MFRMAACEVLSPATHRPATNKFSTPIGTMQPNGTLKGGGRRERGKKGILWSLSVESHKELVIHELHTHTHSHTHNIR